METTDAAERLNALAWNLEYLAEQLAGKWSKAAVGWVEGERIWDVTAHVEGLYGDANVRDIATCLELQLESGPARSKRFADVLVQLYREVKALERGAYIGNPDPFRWMRESRAAAAGKFPAELNRVAEYLWGVYRLLMGVGASAMPDLSPVQDAIYRALTDEYQSAVDIAAAAGVDPDNCRRELANLKSRLGLADHKPRIGYRRASARAL